MWNRNKIKNYAKGSDERIVTLIGQASLITLIIGAGIYIGEMVIKLIITKTISSILWEAGFLLIMILLFVLIHLLNKRPVNR